MCKNQAIFKPCLTSKVQSFQAPHPVMRTVQDKGGHQHALTFACWTSSLQTIFLPWRAQQWPLSQSSGRWHSSRRPKTRVGAFFSTPQRQTFFLIFKLLSVDRKMFAAAVLQTQQQQTLGQEVRLQSQSKRRKHAAAKAYLSSEVMKLSVRSGPVRAEDWSRWDEWWVHAPVWCFCTFALSSGKPSSVAWGTSDCDSSASCVDDDTYETSACIACAGATSCRRSFYGCLCTGPAKQGPQSWK